MTKSAKTVEIGLDALVLAAGVALVLCTPWLNTNGDQEVTGSMLVLGMVVAGTGLWALGGGARLVSHWVHLVLGVLVLVSPWLLQFPAGLDVADSVAIIAGLTTTAAGVIGVLAARRARAQTRDLEQKQQARSSYLAW